MRGEKAHAQPLADRVIRFVIATDEIQNQIDDDGEPRPDDRRFDVVALRKISGEKRHHAQSDQIEMESRIEADEQGRSDDEGEELIAANESVKIVFLLFQKQKAKNVDQNCRCGDPNHDVKLGDKEKNQIENPQNQIGYIGDIARFIDRSIMVRSINIQ